jgi:hypothetical protein
MKTNKVNLAAIAERLRNEKIPETPIKHEWIELATKLFQMDDPRMKEIGDAVLAHHAAEEAAFKAESCSKITGDN